MWQPIETAPKGPSVLVRNDAGERTVAAYDRRFGVWWCEISLGGESTINDNLVEWAPLPD